MQSKTVGKASECVVITEDSTHHLRMVWLEAVAKEDLSTYSVL